MDIWFTVNFAEAKKKKLRRVYATVAILHTTLVVHAQKVHFTSELGSVIVALLLASVSTVVVSLTTLDIALSAIVVVVVVDGVSLAVIVFVVVVDVVVVVSDIADVAVIEVSSADVAVVADVAVI